MTSPPTYNQAAPLDPGGYPLDPREAWVGLVLPRATVNLYTHPSFELVNVISAVLGWTVSGTGATLTRDAGGYRGVFSGRLTVGALGTFAQIVPATGASVGLATASFHVRRAQLGTSQNPTGAALDPDHIWITVNGTPVRPSRLEYVAGGWWRASLTFASGVPGLRIIAPALTAYQVDAAQWEAGDVLTTYCDGDEVGLLANETPAPYAWDGAAHASTSRRSATTRSGGRVVPLTDYGMTLLGTDGLGKAPVISATQEYALRDGATYQRTKRQPRPVTLAGRLDGATPQALAAQRGALRAALAHDLTALDQPVRLIIQRTSDGDPIGDACWLDVRYAGGLEERYQSHHVEGVSLTLVADDPALVRLDELSAEWDGRLGITTYSTGNGVVLTRTAAGAWQQIGTVPNNAVYSATFGIDGRLYVGGAFTTIGGVAANRIAVYNFDTATWAALGTGLNNTCWGLDTDDQGRIVAVGAFTTAGGGGALYVARWNPATSSWSAIGGGLAGTVTDGGRSVLCAPNGDIWARFQRWDGAAWSAAIMGTVFAAGRDGNIYAGDTASGTIRRWDGSATIIGTTDASADTYAVAGLRDGRIVAGGVFSTMNGVSAPRIAAWNGTGWERLIDGTPAQNVYGLDQTDDGIIFAVGDLYEIVVGGVIRPVPGRGVRISGAAALPFDLVSNNTLQPVFRDVRVFRDRIAVVGTVVGAAVQVDSRAVASLTYPGTVPGRPVLRFTAEPSAATPLFTASNETAGAQIGFSVTLLAGEVAALDLRRGVRMASPWRDLTGAILPGSSAGRYLMYPGVNNLAGLVNGGLARQSVTVQPRYESLDDAARTL